MRHRMSEPSRGSANRFHLLDQPPSRYFKRNPERSRRGNWTISASLSPNSHGHSDIEAAQINRKKEKNFQHPKNVVQAPRFTTQFTTTSPRFTTTKHHKIAKPPAKTPLRHKTFSPIHNRKTPPVRLDLCGSSSPSCSSAPLLPSLKTL